jgi:hypothetical protein
VSEATSICGDVSFLDVSEKGVTPLDMGDDGVAGYIHIYVVC